ncbi:hypothetical protein H4R34_001376 [Dimargaris verticillata]|uniref:Fibronectin-binding protein A N-terminus-domain-containing protein n=1 Tax=Dimargaris verticillata TaxID=2761393 RepID=A0A9W8B5M3_9FUNG|nr:hypothetical protein H4R34_001376 [Dimargaris verticillata]
MKQRFSALDVCASVTDLQARVVGLRLQNIYDVTSRTYLLKFSKPQSKDFLLIESGIRLHTTEFTREKANMPSNFCIKLRKHLRTRRLTGVTQLGLDRIVDFEFAGGDHVPTYHLITEFYASGNIILTDSEYCILALLRVVKPNEDTRIAVGQTYDIRQFAREFEPMTADRLITALCSAGPKDGLKKVINTHTAYGPALIEHVLCRANLEPALKVATQFDTAPESPQFTRLLAELTEADRLIHTLQHQPAKGCIVLADPVKSNSALSPTNPDAEHPDANLFTEFHPYRFAQFEQRRVQSYDTFDKAVDTYFSSIEGQKLTMKSRAYEEAAAKKLDSIRQEQMGRIKGLEQAQVTNVHKANLIHQNQELVDQAIAVIRSAVASGMGWKDIEDLVAQERGHSNPVAQAISTLKLKTNRIVLALREQTPVAEDDQGSDTGFSSPLEDDLFASDDDEEDEAINGQQLHQSKRSSLPKPSSSHAESEMPPTLVEVDIYLTAFANAQRYFDVKKQSAVKHEKTVAVSSKALKSAERTIRQNLKETRVTASINKMRKPYWFERFQWFVSSEGYLVLAGRDMQQNELLVQKYLKKHDIYVHADMHGAASVIIKNHGIGEIPPSTLLQAGMMSVCQSKAWEAKIVTSAWWVRAHQVSKSAPSGEYLTTGSFMIRGKKTFLPPAQLVYGFGFLFRLEESCIGRHLQAQRRHQTLPTATATKVTPASNANSLSATGDTGDSLVLPSKDAAAFTQLQSKYNLDEVNENAKGDFDDEHSTESTPFDLESQFTGLRVGTSSSRHQVPNEALPIALPKAKPMSAKEKRTLKKLQKKGGVGDTSSTTNATVSSPITAKNQPPLKAMTTAAVADIATMPADTTTVPPKSPALAPLSPNRSPINMPSGESTQGPPTILIQSDQLPVALADAKDANDVAEIQQILKEENIVPLDPEENLSVLDTLTAQPFPDDILLFAVPVCAPYAALQKYKYRVKLTPGNLKKGKACKAALAVFLNAPGQGGSGGNSQQVDAITAREKELMKSVPDTDLIAHMLPKTKVSAPNLESVKKAKKKKK